MSKKSPQELAQKLQKEWLADKIIFYEDLDDERDATRSKEEKYNRDSRMEKLSEILRIQLQNFFPKDLVNLAVDYVCWSAKENNVGRKIYVHLPASSSHGAKFVEEMKQQFQEWWTDVVNKKSCEFFFSDGTCLGDYEPCVGGTVLHKHITTRGSVTLKNYYGDDPYEKYKFEWPMECSHRDSIFTNILRHKKISVVFDHDKKFGTQGVIFQHGKHNKILIDPPREISWGVQCSKLTDMVQQIGICGKINRSSIKNLPIFLNFTSREEVKNFVVTLVEVVKCPEQHEGMMIFPGLYFRSLKNILCYNVTECSECYEYCYHCSQSDLLTCSKISDFTI